jgi:hypothetical protein
LCVAAGSYETCVARAVATVRAVERDGNHVLLDSAGEGVWRDGGGGAVQGDGNHVLLDSAGEGVWRDGVGQKP